MEIATLYQTIKYKRMLLIILHNFILINICYVEGFSFTFKINNERDTNRLFYEQRGLYNQ